MNSGNSRLARAASRRARLLADQRRFGDGDGARDLVPVIWQEQVTENRNLPTRRHYRITQLVPGDVRSVVRTRKGANLPPRLVLRQQNPPGCKIAATNHAPVTPRFTQAEQLAVNVAPPGNASAVATKQVQGPLPAASELLAYNAAAPDAANRILQLTERQAQHRQKLERARMIASIRDELLGLVLGFVVCLVGIGAGAYVASHSSPLAGSALSFGALATLTGTFVKGRGK